MAGVERSQEKEGVSIIETLALFLAGRLNRSDLSENNQAVLGYYIGLMNEDLEFAAKVNSRKNQLLDPVGHKVPLFSPEVIDSLPKHKRHKRSKNENASQPSLWQNEPKINIESDSGMVFGLENVIDPERKLFEVGMSLDSPFFEYYKNSPIIEEIKKKKMELRNQIGLPIARGKDPHVNDKFYQFLVRRICNQDTFGIFIEYDRVMGEIPEELNLKIKEVEGLIDELLNKNLNRKQRFSTFNQFIKEYNDRWNISDIDENG